MKLGFLIFDAVAVCHLTGQVAGGKKAFRPRA
jgi:hypothetical protein